jgi:hypothetical protein
MDAFKDLFENKVKQISKKNFDLIECIVTEIDILTYSCKCLYQNNVIENVSLRSYNIIGAHGFIVIPSIGSVVTVSLEYNGRPKLYKTTKIDKFIVLPELLGKIYLGCSEVTPGNFDEEEPILLGKSLVELIKKIDSDLSNLALAVSTHYHMNLGIGVVNAPLISEQSSLATIQANVVTRSAEIELTKSDKVFIGGLGI